MPKTPTIAKDKDLFPITRWRRDIENMALLESHFHKSQAGVYRDLAEWKVQELHLRDE